MKAYLDLSDRNEWCREVVSNTDNAIVMFFTIAEVGEVGDRTGNKTDGWMDQFHQDRFKSSV